MTMPEALESSDRSVGRGIQPFPRSRASSRSDPSRTLSRCAAKLGGGVGRHDHLEEDLDQN